MIGEIFLKSKKLCFSTEFFCAVGSGVEPHTREDTGRVSVVALAVRDYLPRTYRSDIITEVQKNNNPLKGMLFPVPYRYAVSTTDTHYLHSTPKLRTCQVEVCG